MFKEELLDKAREILDDSPEYISRGTIPYLLLKVLFAADMSDSELQSVRVMDLAEEDVIIAHDIMSAAQVELQNQYIKDGNDAGLEDLMVVLQTLQMVEDSSESVKKKLDTAVMIKDLEKKLTGLKRSQTS